MIFTLNITIDFEDNVFFALIAEAKNSGPALDRLLQYIVQALILNYVE
jgi:hypothetical protein